MGYVGDLCGRTKRCARRRGTRTMRSSCAVTNFMPGEHKLREGGRGIDSMGR